MISGAVRERRGPAGRRAVFSGAAADRFAPKGTAHAVHRLAPGLLLVFKPRGHREAEHAHAHRQRLVVLRGRLALQTTRRKIVLEPSSGPLVLAAGRRHATEALADTWLVAEALSATRARRRRSRPPAVSS